MLSAELLMCPENDSPESEPADDELLAAYGKGEEWAAEVLFGRYCLRLKSFAHKHMGPLLREVEESSDITQSAFQSVFKRARDGRIQLGPHESLWPLLAKITENKVRNRGKHWRRKRRDRRRHESLKNVDPLISGPTPEDTATADDLIQELLALFDERRQEMIKYILADVPVAEIAQRMDTTKRTVYRVRQAATHILEEILAAS